MLNDKCAKNHLKMRKFDWVLKESKFEKNVKRKQKRLAKMVPRLLEPGTIGQGKGDMKSVLATAGAAIHPFIYPTSCYYIINQMFEFEKTRANSSSSSSILQSAMDSLFLNEIARCKHQT